jgi:uncharacterized small protein (DUF1192 family)
VLEYLYSSYPASQPESLGDAVRAFLERLVAMSDPPPAQITGAEFAQRLMLSVAQLETRLNYLAADINRVETSSGQVSLLVRRRRSAFAHVAHRQCTFTETVARKQSRWTAASPERVLRIARLVGRVLSS